MVGEYIHSICNGERGGGGIGNNCRRFILLLYIKHGVEDLTLVEMTHVFMVEPLSNHGMDRQVINWVHQIGQKERT